MSSTESHKLSVPGNARFERCWLWMLVSTELSRILEHKIGECNIVDMSSMVHIVVFVAEGSSVTESTKCKT
jgi:hypothetical protein